MLSFFMCYSRWENDWPFFMNSFDMILFCPSLLIIGLYSFILWICIVTVSTLVVEPSQKVLLRIGVCKLFFSLDLKILFIQGSP